MTIPEVAAPALVRPDSPAVRLGKDLAASFHSRSINAARRWRYPTVDTAMIRLTRAGTCPAQYRAFQSVAVAYATWHSGQARPHPGRAGTSVGRALRQLGRPGAYGPDDPAAQRTLDRLVQAGTYDDLHPIIVRAAAQLGSADHPPHWVTLAEDLIRWQTDPDPVRVSWARDFYTYQPSVPAP